MRRTLKPIKSGLLNQCNPHIFENYLLRKRKFFYFYAVFGYYGQNGAQLVIELNDPSKILSITLNSIHENHIRIKLNCPLEYA